MGPNIQIDFLQANVDDAGAILSLIQQLEHFISREALIANLREKQNSSDYLVLVAKVSGHIIGFAELHFMHFVYEEKARARLTSFCIHSQYRNQNIGSSFLKHMEELCGTRNIFRIELTSNLRRGDAHRFYEKNGYSFVSKAFHKSL